MSSAHTSPGRRLNGQGSIAEVRPGVWRLRVLVGLDAVTRHPIQRSRTVHGTRAAAERELTRFRSELIDKPPARQQTASRPMLDDLIEAHLRASTLAPGTQRGYESLFRCHIRGGFGRIRTTAITADVMRAYYSGLAVERGLSPATVWAIYSLISGSLRRAAREHGLVFDFNQIVTPPKPQADKRAYATDDELARLFTEAGALGADWALLFRLACATGMRRGELVALRWDSYDTDRQCLYVDSSITDTKGGLAVKPPKNGHPRYVALDDDTVRMWMSFELQVLEHCAVAGVAFRRDRLVFTNDPDGMIPWRPDRVSAVWSKLRDTATLNAGLEFRALRNWHVTVLDDELGFELAKIARRVGHTRSRSAIGGMTAHYSLSDRKVDAKMAKGVALRLKRITART